MGVSRRKVGADQKQCEHTVLPAQVVGGLLARGERGLIRVARRLLLGGADVGIEQLVGAHGPGILRDGACRDNPAYTAHAPRAMESVRSGAADARASSFCVSARSIKDGSTWVASATYFMNVTEFSVQFTTRQPLPISDPAAIDARVRFRR